ncbi:hypothetical protein ID854_08395 [Xenorhabdus sp. M]|uniref:Integrase n=1 Tax=Xenorhabdus szentirmaii TaxID=290112 RepID=A0AAW3YUP0_9GAMM|nr:MULTISPECIES: hypothetical protein [unclassified Xenorhabdus]MBD2800477.1 hypothetical protein [Xenorhabdus sp. M]MBD2805322.1 hypothetical protein [Xenorhabdus sp. ZM]
MAELEQNGVPTQNNAEDLTVGDLLSRFINNPNLGKKQEEQKNVLNTLLKSDLAKLPLTKLSVNHIIEHCKQRHSKGLPLPPSITISSIYRQF